MEIVKYLFFKVTHMDEEFQLFLHAVLVNMIKFHFKGNSELLTMVTEPVYNENYEGMTIKEYAQMEIERLIEKNWQLELLLNEQEDRINEMNCGLDKKEDRINEISDENLKLKQRIIELERFLDG